MLKKFFKRIDEKALLDAAEKGDINRLAKLVEKGVDVNAQDSFGATAVSLAAYNYNNGCLVYLLRSGANPDIKNKLGKTALHMVVSSTANVFGAGILIEAGANVNTYDDLLAKNTPLIEAVRVNQILHVKTLLDAPEISLSLRDAFGRNALDWAQYLENKELEKLLLKAEAKVEKKAAVCLKLKQYHR